LGCWDSTGSPVYALLRPLWEDGKMEIKDPEEVRNTVLRVVEAMLVRKIITRGEARMVVFAVAEDLRREARGTPSEKAADELARSLTKATEERWARK
jgi:hypothetical protein